MWECAFLLFAGIFPLDRSSAARSWKDDGVYDRYDEFLVRRAGGVSGDYGAFDSQYTDDLLGISSDLGLKLCRIFLLLQES